MENWRIFGALSVYIGLFTISLLYDRLVHWLEVNRHADGRTAYLVVIGVAYTLLGLGLVDIFLPNINAGLLAFSAFALSGLPMIIGSRNRYSASKEHGLIALVEDLHLIAHRSRK